jgi:predicted kinase
MECIVFTGIQASGKSTFYKKRYFRTHMRISLDMLKTRNRENKLLKFCLETSQSFVVDNTNPTVSDRKKYIVPAKERKFKIIGYYFESKISECKKRNSLRNACEIVPDIAVSGTYNKMQIPGMEEGFDELYFVSLKDNDFLVKEWKDEI